MLMEMTISVGSCLKRKAMLARVKEYIKKTLQIAKVFVACRNYVLLQTKTPKYKYWVHKNGALTPKWCGLAGSTMTHSVCICSAYQNVVLLADAVDWDLTYKDLLKLTLFCRKYFH